MGGSEPAISRLPTVPMIRVLFVTMHRPRRSPGQRFRYEQYLPYLREHGFECDVSHLISETDDRVIYAPGHYFSKFGIFLKSVAIRLRDVIAAGRYDIVFIFREALMVNSGVIEALLARGRARLVFDFDDAIWMQQPIAAKDKLRFLRAGPSKIPGILRHCDMVFAGNAYLADYASRFNDSVHIVPTTLDTSTHTSQPRPAKDRVCIGWNGSFSTVSYFDQITTPLAALKARFGDAIYFKLIGDATYQNPALDLKGQAWREETEVEDTLEFDIGLMPLSDDPWTRGKCGFKALLYMSLQIPPVVSPVGVNSEIVEDGVSGFTATTDQEWVDKIATLVERPDLRAKFGERGRDVVVQRYSLDSQKDRYVQLLSSLV
jgi:glycosyltransferase involved in cell wall biosynthesis